MENDNSEFTDGTKIKWVIGYDDFIPDGQTQARILQASGHSDHLVEIHKLDIAILYAHHQKS